MFHDQIVKAIQERAALLTKSAQYYGHGKSTAARLMTDAADRVLELAAGLTQAKQEETAKALVAVDDAWKKKWAETSPFEFLLAKLLKRKV